MFVKRAAALLSAGLPDRMTERYRFAVENAVGVAERTNCETIEVTHLLAGLLGIKDGIAYHVLKNLGFELETFTEQLLQFPRLHAVSKNETSNDAIDAIHMSVDWVRRFGHSKLDTEHLLLGLIENKTIELMFLGCGVKPTDIGHEIRGLHGLLP